MSLVDGGVVYVESSSRQTVKAERTRLLIVEADVLDKGSCSRAELVAQV
jgi:hypothetical protein